MQQYEGKIMMQSLARIVTSVMTLSIVSACAMFPPTLLEQGIVRTEIKESNPVRITRATVYREDGMTVVRGEAAFPAWQSFGIFTGHIDIDIAIPGNDVLKKRNVSLIRKRIPKERGRRAFFVSRFSIEPPKGTIVRVTHHEGTHEIPS